MQIAHFNVENGLPSNNVYSVVEDRFGFIWILTDEGIAKYNGYTFKIFNTSNGLPSNDVWYLSEDSHGRLWIYTHSYEVGYLKDDIYHKVNIDTRNSLTKILRQFEQKGTVCLVTFDVNGEHTYIVDSSDKVTPLPGYNQDYRVMALDSNNISAIYKYRYFVQFMPKATGLTIINKIRSRLKAYSFLIPAVMPNGHIITFDVIDQTQIAVVDGETWSVAYGTMTKWGGRDSEKAVLVYIIRGQFILITDHAAYVINKDFTLNQKEDYSSFLNSSAPISFFYETRNKSSKWFCTKDNGCYQVFKPTQQFYRSSSLTQMLSGVKQVGVFRNGDSWWYKESSGTLLRLNKQATDIHGFKVNRQLIKVIEGPNNNNILFISKQNIETFNLVSHALQPLLPKSKPIFVKNLYNYDYSVVLKKRTDRKEELNDLAKKSLLSGGTDLIWYNDSNFYFPSASSHLWNVRLSNDHIDISSVHEDKYNSIFYDSVSKRLWLYNKGSVVIINPADNSKIELNNKLLETLGLNVIEQIATDKYHNVFIKDADKILLFSLTLGTAKFLKLSVDISSARMWISNDWIQLAGKFGIASAYIQGPSKVSRFSITPNIRRQHYSRVNDLILTSQGTTILSTDKGIYLADGTRQSGIFNNNIFAEAMVAKLPEQRLMTGRGDTLKINGDINLMTFDYINYYGKGDRVFSYKIDGLSDWKQTTTGEIYLGEINPDRMYKVECKVSDDLWKSKNYTFFIYRIPYWYQTDQWKKLFWIAGVFALSLIILMVVLITKKVVARSSEKRQMQIELELRAIHSQINPHFIFNTLSSALYFISKKNFESAYHHVNKFSKLLRLYLQASRNRYTVLSEEIELLTKYIDLQKVRFEGKFDYTIEIDKRVPTDSIQIPSLLLQPLVENAINHGLFHIERGGLLQIKFVQGSSSDELLCYIDDNGVGRERSKEIKNESESYRRSYGTKLTEELIELFEKYEKMNIEMEYLDKKAPETGTVVKLTLRNMKYMV